jgi:hypothetical protein
MRYPCRVALLAALIVLAVGLVSEALAGEGLFRRKPTMDPQRMNAANGYPGGATDPVPLPGPRPYWGQALGATYYNWGYFGTHQHSQYTFHTGYYGEYTQFGYSRGY